MLQNSNCSQIEDGAAPLAVVPQASQVLQLQRQMEDLEQQVRQQQHDSSFYKRPPKFAWHVPCKGVKAYLLSASN